MELLQGVGEANGVARAEVAYHQVPKRNEVSPCQLEVAIAAD